MKFKNILLIFLSLILLQSAHAQISLCNSIYKSLKEHKLSPDTQNLILNGDNAFPYNILLNFKGQGKSNLILVFFQEDAAENMEVIYKTVSFIKGLDTDTNITILFSYGEKQKIIKEGMIFGSEVFAESLNSTDENTAIIFDLNADHAKVLSSSRKLTAPSYLIQAAFNSFQKSGLGKALPNYYVSQLYRYNFFYDRILSSFFSHEIPAIRLNLPSNLDQETVFSVIQNITTAYSQESNREWDHHFLMIRIINNYFRLIETTTIRIIILIFFIWVFFIFMLIFVNIRQKRTTWNSIKHVWYTFPVTYILTVISFVLGKLLFTVFFHPATDARRVIYLCAFQLLITLYLCATFYMILLLLNTKFSEKSIDYLIIFSCFINQSIFILVDISLFPIFMTICFLSILAFVIKNNPLHISIFFLMMILFLPYISSLLINTNITELRVFLLTNNRVPFYLSALLSPLLLIYFRILTSIARNSKRKLTFFIAHSTFFVIVIILLPIVSTAKAKKIEKLHLNKEIIYERNRNDEEITITYSDKKIFDDLIRTIDIELNGECLQCDVRLRGSNFQPVLYTDNDYYTLSTNQGYFKVPSNPPQNMTFRYGTDERTSILTVTAFFKTDNEDVCSLLSKTITLEAQNE